MLFFYNIPSIKVINKFEPDIKKDRDHTIILISGTVALFLLAFDKGSV